MNLLKYHYDNDLLARDNNFLNFDSNESHPGQMAVECFAKLQNQELPEEEIESNEEFDTFFEGAFATSKIAF